MSMHVALLRGINVGGRNWVAMADLCDLLGALRFAGVRSLLQSGNLILESDRRTGAELERLLEEETARRLGVTGVYVVRTRDEWQTVVAGNPLPDEAETAPQAEDVRTAISSCARRSRRLRRHADVHCARSPQHRRTYSNGLSVAVLPAAPAFGSKRFSHGNANEKTKSRSNPLQ
jgi:uncharacterized protein (DUF1697 family)